MRILVLSAAINMGTCAANAIIFYTLSMARIQGNTIVGMVDSTMPTRSERC